MRAKTIPARDNSRIAGVSRDSLKTRSEVWERIPKSQAIALRSLRAELTRTIHN